MHFGYTLYSNDDNMANDTPGEDLPKSDLVEASTEGSAPPDNIPFKNEAQESVSSPAVKETQLLAETTSNPTEPTTPSKSPPTTDVQEPLAGVSEEVKGIVKTVSPVRRGSVRSRRREEAKRSPAKRGEDRPGRGGKRHRGDREFLPSIDMMIHDYDDERTIAEEESLGIQEDPQTELSSLQKEGDMPIEDLMAMYGYGDDVNGSRPPKAESRLCPDESESSARPSRSAARQQSEDEAECSAEEEEKKKTIMIGSDYQARVPAGLCKYDDALPYENEDKLVWDPSKIASREVDDFLREVSKAAAEGGLPRGAHVRDDEQALYMLLQCGYNTEEAHRRLRLSSSQPDDMSPWSEEECRNYELGLRSFGKDFRRIHQHKVKTRTVSELVQFYYLWKKTERHDVFANSARLEKKKYSLHPGITDYMDRFLDEQDGSNSRERSSSPATTDNQPVIKVEKEEKDQGEEGKPNPNEKILLNP